MLEPTVLPSEGIDVLYTRANALLAQKQLDSAAELYRQIIACSYNDSLLDRDMVADVFHNLGMIAEERGDYEAALSNYQQAVIRNEQRFMTWLFIARIHFYRFDRSQQKSDYSSAKRALRKAEAIEAGYPAVRHLKSKYLIA